MATRSSILALKIPWTEEPGGLESTGSQKDGHDWAHTHKGSKDIPKFKPHLDKWSVENNEGTYLNDEKPPFHYNSDDI